MNLEGFTGRAPDPDPLSRAISLVTVGSTLEMTSFTAMIVRSQGETDLDGLVVAANRVEQVDFDMHAKPENFWDWVDRML